MIRLEDVQAFVWVARTQSYTKAQEALGVTKSTVSRRVDRLEEALSAQLLNRTTRQVQLSDMGRLIFERASEAVEALEELPRAVALASEDPVGTLRVTFPIDLGSVYAGRLSGEFQARHPRLSLEVLATDRYVDLVKESVDVALRIFTSGPPDASGLVGRRLGPVAGAFFGAPSYLERRGRPARPEELERHELVCFARDPRRTIDAVGPDGERRTVTMSGALRADNLLVVRDMILAGAGIGWVPCFLMEDQPGERVLPGWQTQQGELWILWPATRQMSAAMRAFVDFAVEWLRGHAWEQPRATGELP